MAALPGWRGPVTGRRASAWMAAGPLPAWRLQVAGRPARGRLLRWQLRRLRRPQTCWRGPGSAAGAVPAPPAPARAGLRAGAAGGDRSGSDRARRWGAAGCTGGGAAGGLAPAGPGAGTRAAIGAGGLAGVRNARGRAHRALASETPAALLRRQCRSLQRRAPGLPTALSRPVLTGKADRTPTVRAPGPLRLRCPPKCMGTAARPPRRPWP